ncbi:hypothetical protein KAI58_02110 [Candidatus Gracilibacteria bacterium]|nr:hypothetical protein [Candidatus Gracilibacteria bacterium]
MKGWKKDLPHYFPNDEIVFLDELLYLHTQQNKMNKIVQKGIELLNDGKETIILSHSFGGILGKTMIDQAKNHQVKKFITMATPHEMNIFGVRKAKQFLKTPKTVSVETQSFGGFLDLIVPYFWSKPQNSIQHDNFWCEHISFLLIPATRRKVLKNCQVRTP